MDKFHGNPSTPSFAQLLANPVLLLAFGFGSGLAPKAPGTFGTLIAIPLFLLIPELNLFEYAVLTVAVSLLGIWICGYASQWTAVKDHSGIVYDEIAGYLVTMFAMPSSWLWIVVGFLLFRLFDIWKPGPIGWLDRRCTGGFGIMIDDLAAGALACGCMHGLNYFF